LLPGVPGISENIRVRSIVDRFLEHARIVWWKNGGSDAVYLSSADWMPRNLNRRIEVAVPVLDSDQKKRITEEIFPTEWSDNTFAWELGADGDYRRVEAGGQHPNRAQQSFITLARERAKRSVTLRPDLAKDVSPAARVVFAQYLRRAADLE
jgi:polyphosphate kinase